jgi:hypothetical protein
LGQSEGALCLTQAFVYNMGFGFIRICLHNYIALIEGIVANPTTIFYRLRNLDWLLVLDLMKLETNNSHLSALCVSGLRNP